VSGHPVTWVTASPLWPDVLQGEPAETATRARMRRPALLRFASDDFMDELAKLLADDPGGVAALEATPESFRVPPPGEPEDWQPELEHLKLFQAVHGHFYLVAATLACRVPGLPEHPADPSRGETVSFVLRRLEGEAEWAWAKTGWKQPDDPATLAEDEDELPLFPLNYVHKGRRRRLYVGLVPTSSRETFAAGGSLAPAADATFDAREAAFEAAVFTPMSLELSPDAATRLEATRIVLAELIGLLRSAIPSVFHAIVDNAQAPGAAAGTLLHELEIKTVGSLTWRAALKLAWEQHLAIAGESADPVTLVADLAASTLDAKSLKTLFVKALPEIEDAPPPAEVPKLDSRGEAVYALRCVYKRPMCGPLKPAVVSDPTGEFTIAPFYDMDAPVRPVLITLPANLGLKDLRRFRKGVSFVLSEQLQKQMSRVKSLKDALDKNIGEGQQFDIGVICSFSIPIITIVALILIMMIVGLLNLVFMWMPLLRICVPIGKAKS
jgi:hypothetical protein